MDVNISSFFSSSFITNHPANATANQPPQPTNWASFEAGNIEERAETFRKSTWYVVVCVSGGVWVLFMLFLPFAVKFDKVVRLCCCLWRFLYGSHLCVVVHCVYITGVIACCVACYADAQSEFVCSVFTVYLAKGV